LSPNSASQHDNRLDFLDQAAFLSMRATGLGQLMQVVWIYRRPVDAQQLRRFHQNFGHGLFGRRIQRSPLPFGRHRWVASPGPATEFVVEDGPRPREALGAWMDERAEVAVDPEAGPTWHLAMLPMTDGTTAVSLVMSHCVSDGAGAMLSIVNAVKGNTGDFGYPPPRDRTRLRDVAADVGAALRGLPELVRTLGAAVGFAVRHRRDLLGAAAPRQTPVPATTTTPGGDELFFVPVVTVFITGENWDARAEALGGNSYSLLAGLGAKLGHWLGRVRADDGAVNLVIPISDRVDGDTRAAAMPFANVSVDPSDVSTDLTAARSAIRQAVAAVREQPDEVLTLLPLIQLVPDWAVEKMADGFLGSAALPVTCSNLGDLDPVIARPDGADADFVVIRGLNQHVKRADLERTGGQLFLVATRINGTVTFNVGAYRPQTSNDRSELRALVLRALDEFGLVWEPL
jgi:hypothetical protein